ncbi:MAG: copper chaperone PCu(A)C [Anaerolineae bacterium]|jgi:copper(I)-binding protein|nr:copper chaperone PCu(A)C [Anaerolineae bacterium]MBT7989187.1 copper chaperone PCu(A)C [Anaerolineae bacterium]
MQQKSMRKKILISLFLLSSMLLLIGCSSAEEMAPSDTSVEEADILIEGAWSRSTPELMDGSGITYMLIQNNGSADDRLLAAKTDVCDVVELHEHKMDSNGMMRMRMVEGGYIDIPAGGEVELTPGGLHLMLINLHEGLETGTSYELTLKFEKMGEVMIEVPVVDIEPKN